MQNKSGSANNPISIDLDDQSTNEREVILNAARNKIIIEEAEFFSDPLDLCFAAVKTSINGDIPTKQRKLNHAIIEYFKKEIGINISCDYFEPLLEPDYSNPDTVPNPCQILVYGVDFLTTKLIKDRFTIVDTTIREIVWINDSICKLIFGSATEVQLVVRDQTKTVKMEEDCDALPRDWFSINSYQIFSFDRPLVARYATSLEKELPKKKKQSYEKFAFARVQLAKHLLEEFKATNKYKILVEDVERKRFLNRRRPDRDRSHNMSRTREKYRTHSRFSREFEDNRREPRGYRNRYDPDDSFRMESTQVKYAHRPANPDDSYELTGFRNRNQSNRERQHNTSFNYERGTQEKQFLDFPQPNQGINTSFNYHNPASSNKRLNDLSFQRQERGTKKFYDAADIDSEMSFNQFGSIRKANNEREDFHCDFNQEERRSLFGEVNVSFRYDNQRPRRQNFDTDYQQDQRRNNKITANQSFNFEDRPRNNRDRDMNQSFVFNKNGGNKHSREEQDFFQRLNSAVSSVREINEQDFKDNNSFEYDKKNDPTKTKTNNLLSESFYNQDSY